MYACEIISTSVDLKNFYRHQNVFLTYFKIEIMSCIIISNNIFISIYLTMLSSQVNVVRSVNPLPKK